MTAAFRTAVEANAQQTQRLEQLIAEVCQAQPSLPAPLRLQTKVMAEVRRRAALPWWRKSFGHWPMAARSALVMVSSGVAWLTFWVLAQLQTQHYATQMADSVAKPIALMRTVTQLLALLDYIVTLLLARIPNVWWYGGVLSVVTGYAVMLGVGAVIYRGWFVRR